MAVTFACEKCQAEYTVADALAGKRGRCNSCGHLMQVPGASRASSGDSTIGGRSSSSTGYSMPKGKSIGFADGADPLDNDNRDIPARSPENTCPSCGGSFSGGILCTRCGYNSRTGKKTQTVTDPDPLGALEAVADDGTIPFSEDLQRGGSFSLNISGAAAFVMLILGVAACLLPLLNQPALSAYGRLPVYTGLALGLVGAFLIVQKGRGTQGVVAGAVVVAAFFGGVMYKPRPTTTAADKVVAQKTTPRSQNSTATGTRNKAVGLGAPMNAALRSQLNNLNSIDSAARLAAAQQLVLEPPQDRLADVARAMEPKLTEDDARLRLLAIQGVMLQPGDHTAAVLAPLVHDPDRSVREAALRALGKIPGVTSLQAIASRLADDPAGAREALAAAEGGNPRTSIDAFKQMLDQNRDARLRAIAIDELAARNTTDLAEPFAALIGDPSPRVRDAAIRALARLKVTSAIRAISDKLGESEDAVAALQSFGPAAEKDTLVLANSPNKLVRAAAARVLITAATPQNLETVQRLAADEDRAVAAAALEAWKRLVPADFTPLQDALRDLASSDVLRQRKALGKLAELKPDEHRSKVAVQLLSVALGDDADLRAHAAKALSIWGTRDSLLMLVQALNDHEPLRQERAKEVLGHLKDPRAIDPLADLAEKGNLAAVDALAAMGPMAEDGALRLLNCADPAVQLAAIRALGDIGTGRSVQPLGAIMRSRPNNAARNDDREALRKINLRITEQAREETKRKIKTVPTTAPASR